MIHKCRFIFNSSALFYFSQGDIVIFQGPSTSEQKRKPIMDEIAQGDYKYRHWAGSTNRACMLDFSHPVPWWHGEAAESLVTR